MARIRVAHFIHFDGPGGGPVMAGQLAEGLQKDFDQVVFLAGEGKFRTKCAELGIPVVSVPTAKLWQSFFGIFSLARELRRHKIDLIILHGQWAGPIGSLAAKLAKTPHSIYIAHWPAFFHCTSLFKIVRNQIAEKIPCSHADRVVALSKGNHYNYLIRRLATDATLRIINNGTNFSQPPTEEDRASFRSQHGMEAGVRHVVFAGRLDDQKRPDWMLKAWAHALTMQTEVSPPWHLWMVGDGKERSHCENLVKDLGLSESVHFVGNQPDGRAWISASDLVVMSSLYEGHALVPLEAMAASRPVVAFETDGITDSVEHQQTGLLCDLGDTKALGQNIARLLLNDHERKTFGENGARVVREKFSLGKMQGAYSALIHEVSQRSESQKESPPGPASLVQATS